MISKIRERSPRATAVIGFVFLPFVWLTLFLLVPVGIFHDGYNETRWGFKEAIAQLNKATKALWRQLVDGA